VIAHCPVAARDAAAIEFRAALRRIRMRRRQRAEGGPPRLRLARHTAAKRRFVEASYPAGRLRNDYTRVEPSSNQELKKVHKAVPPVKPSIIVNLYILGATTR
jgi:hypothetical protein